MAKVADDGDWHNNGASNGPFVAYSLNVGGYGHPANSHTFGTNALLQQPTVIVQLMGN